ncbi:MAG: enolase, partial [Candidatus Micrarchaeia archaeon]
KKTEVKLNPLELDKKMLTLDGTPNKANLGANAIVATSMAIIKAIADEQEKPLYKYISELAGTTPKLPQPMFNIINGGKHAGNGLAVQEFMIMPKGKTFSETLRMASEIYHVLGKILVDKYGPAAKNVGDEGGYAPPIGKTEEALDAIMNAIETAGYAGETKIAMDCAASSFYESVMKTYHIDGLGVSRDTLLKYYGDFLKKYPIASIEDPFDENDFDGFAALLETTNNKIMVVGDDLLVTNPERIKQGIEHNSCNALLLKVNQIGSVSESLNAAEMCRKAGWNIVVSHRSGETEDTFIADFAVGIGSEYLKTGAPARGERTCKYNQLLRIEEGL